MRAAAARRRHLAAEAHFGPVHMIGYPLRRRGSTITLAVVAFHSPGSAGHDTSRTRLAPPQLDHESFSAVRGAWMLSPTEASR